MQFDKAKLKAVILFVVSKCDPSRLGAIKLNKTLYFLDMIHYAATGTPVTGATYKKRPWGPASDQILFALKEMAAEGLIKISQVDYFGFKKTEYTPLVHAEAERLSAKEIDLLNEVIQFVCWNNTAKTISDFSHQRPWEMAEFGDVIPYRTSYLLIPSEVSAEALDWAESEAKKVDDYSQSRSGEVVCTDASVFRSRLRKASAV